MVPGWKFFPQRLILEFIKVQQDSPKISHNLTMKLPPPFDYTVWSNVLLDHFEDKQ